MLLKFKTFFLNSTGKKSLMMTSVYFVAISIAVFSASACHHGAGAEDVILPSGQPGFVVSCDATKVKCYKAAAQKCPSGYTVVEESKMDSSEAKASAWSGRAHSRSKTDLGMLIECKGAKSTKPKASSSGTDAKAAP